MIFKLFIVVTLYEIQLRDTNLYLALEQIEIVTCKG